VHPGWLLKNCNLLWEKLGLQETGYGLIFEVLQGCNGETCALEAAVALTEFVHLWQ